MFYSDKSRVRRWFIRAGVNWFETVENKKRYMQSMCKYKIIQPIIVRGALIVTVKHVLCEGLHAHFILVGIS